MTVVHPADIVPGTRLDRVRGAARIDGSGDDLDIADGVVVAPGLGATEEVSVDAEGWMLLAPAADMHAHIDKAYTWHDAGEPEGSLDDAVRCWQTFGASLSGERIGIHARKQIDAALRAGVTTIRTHVNYHEGDDPLRGIRAVVEAREDYRGLVDVQIVAMHSHLVDDALVRDAIALGADLIGAAPHLSDDPRREIDRAAVFAETAGIGIDLHTDETLAPESLGILDLARRTRDWPSEMSRTAGHCVSLAMQEPQRLTAILDEVAAAGVSIVVNPLTNLYLQGWQHPVATPRGIPPLGAILDAGIALAAGGDNVQDPFNPLGNGDMVDVASALVLAGHLSPDLAWQTVTAGRHLQGAASAPGRIGDPADFILVRARSTAEALAERAPDRVVVRGGTVVATRSQHTAALPARTREGAR